MVAPWGRMAGSTSRRRGRGGRRFRRRPDGQRAAKGAGMAGTGRLTRRDLMLAAIATGALTAPLAGASAYERDGDRKIIVWGGRTPVTNLDPHQRFDSPHYLVQSCLYDPLVRYFGNPAQIAPWLAQSWEASADARTWTFHLVSSAKFADGTPLDAEAVRYSFTRALQINKAVSWMLHDVLDPSGIATPDPQTVRFTLK